MDRFARLVIRFRLWVITLCILLTVAGALSIAKWSRIEADFSKYLPEEDPVVKRFNEAGDRFGGVAVAMVGIEYPDVFNTTALAEIAELTAAVEKLPGVSWVVSLTEMDDVQSETVDGEPTVSVRPVVDPEAIPTDPAALAKLKSYVLGKDGLVRVVVGPEARLANLTFGIDRKADRVEVATAVEAVVRERLPERKLYFAGFPYWMKNMSAIIIKDMLVLVPVVSLLVILILLLAFRSVRGVVLPMLTVIISATWAMGLMAALRIPITMLSNVIPVLLIALGTAYAIHLLHKVDEVQVEEGQEFGRHLRAAMVDVMVPIGLAGLTTVIGFLSFLTSNLVFIQHFGLMAAFGIFSAMLVALTLLPAILSYQKPTRARGKAGHGEGPGWLGRMLDRLGAAVMRRRVAVLITAICVAGVAAAFIPGLDRRFNMVAYFPDGSEVRQADAMMKNKLGGNVPVWVTVEGPSKEPFVLAQMHTIEKYLQTIPEISNVRSVAGLIAQMNQVMVAERTIPATAAGVGNLWFNLEGKDVLTQFVDKERAHALIQGVSRTSDTSRLRKVVADLQAFLAQVPTRAVQVDLAKAPADLADRARQARRAAVTLNLWLDLRHRLGEGGLDRASLDAWLTKALASPPGPAPAAEYAEQLGRFLASDEADLEIEDPELAKKLATQVATTAAAGQARQPQIQDLIRKTLPEELISEDPEGVGYLAKSLAVLVDEVTDRRRSQALLDGLLAKLPADAKQDSLLQEELNGDLAPFNTRLVWMPVAEGQAPAGTTPTSARFEQTGMHHISVNVDNRLVYSQLSSLGLAALLAMILLMIQFRSILAGLLGMIPMVLTLLVNFGAMAAFGIYLESATVLIASLVVGVGIDYTIHFLSRTRLEMIRNGEPAGALEVAQRTAGRAILINAVTVTMGQLVFLAGELIPLHYFGALLALAMVTSALAAVTVMPAVLLITRPKFLKRGRGPTPEDAQA